MDKKNSSMVTRSMGEGALFSFVMLLVFLYIMYTYGYLKPFENWEIGIRTTVTLILLPVVFGVGFGFFQSFRFKRRLERLRGTLVAWEKGNLTPAMPVLGTDELGRLGEQLGRISGKWENQVNTLQRLSTNNAKLAEQARVSAIIEERQRLARELHDAVSQQLFAISMTATAVGRTLEKDFDKAQRQIALIEEMSAVAQSEMRALLLHLRPVYLEGKGLEQGLQELIKELQIKVPMEIIFEMDPDVQLLKGVENHLFRIVQEAISNTLRHAKAEKMEIRLHRRGDSVRLTLRDDGMGFEIDDSKLTSYGLSNMQERIAETGGSIQFITAPGKGMRIEITVPLVNE
ncbi:NarL family two-component system sensor histidine kinase LiaS [Paenibacillus sp. PastF-1]|nr:NarL family two-component system sensor histidine kinase LiaS [Paenibacillus sp. PastF-2]MDF9850882.1 NarL family two-component system sensor histidine kinase LiaS [Paenibacillus sp. PastM-2]MDF9857504.1 NarL family two-component system sensor histidine kinase LiaS [Paenibacillus sp. PastF-1]MDH6482720.1 NarL family two-component system sensor histidine kinase LiaS [Paenibacillus sp. PastH-2]MDH6510146.1 NarL family two-component system sensor histidine kinase LiaS [Paenibacillus sp. PastM-3